ncbi:hypothetical protein P4O66_017099, partial [Electrophorus voltai]
IYVAIGSSVKLPCGDGMTKGTEWRVNGSMLVSGPVLHLHNTSLEDQGIYTCHSPNGGHIETLHVWMGYAPSPPVVQCWSPSYPLKAVCSWTQTPDPILPTYYIATYWFMFDRYPRTEQPLVHSCRRESDQDQQCILEELELYATVPHLVNITAVNGLGSATRILPILIDDISKILLFSLNTSVMLEYLLTTGLLQVKRYFFPEWPAVKPDPPVNVKVTLQPGRKLHVQWAPPPSWPDPVNFTLKYKVQFQWDKRKTASI